MVLLKLNIIKNPVFWLISVLIVGIIVVSQTTYTVLQKT